MRAAIVAVGSEMLGTRRLDTNSLKIAAALERHGVELARKSVVGDLEADLEAELRGLLAGFELIVVTGGLGPTADDVTRAATAAALGQRPVRVVEELVAEIAERFRRMGLEMPVVNRRQAEVIAGAEVLPNARGTAPGMRLEEGRATLFLFPGVPAELEGMIATYLEPWLAVRSGGASREMAVLKVAGLPESTLEERIAPAYAEFGREAITVLAKASDIEVQTWAVGEPEERRRRLAAVTARLRELIGPAVYAEREAELEEVVGELLRARGATVVTAESCTGGLVAERLTRVPGSSDYFLGGVVSYSNDLKTALLGVAADLLAAHGAVSEPVARAMAEGARQRLGSDFAIAVTGVAGPGGGTPEKPVGTVHLAVAGPGDGEVQHRRVAYPGDRQRIRWLASQVALEMLRRRLLAAGAPGVRR
jgi:competence/damage-inducible protein CinA-like protein